MIRTTVKLLRCGVLVTLVMLASTSSGAQQNRPKPIYSNEFAVHIPDGDQAADEIAAKHGFFNRGQVSPDIRVTLTHLCCY